jgi:Membrane domain of glycerophosphoryl diester phosphodiesterase
MYVRPSAPQSIGGVIDDAIRLYRHSFSRCWLIALAASALYGAVIFSVALEMPHHAATGGGSAGTIAAQQVIGREMGGYFLLLAVAMMAFQGALIARQAAFARGDESATLGSALATGFARLPTFILSTILLYLGVGFSTFLVVIVLVLPIGWVLNHQHLLVRPVLIGAFVTIMVLSLLYLIVRLQLFMVAIFAERKGPKASLTTSWHLTKGHWWRSLAILSTGMIIIMVLFLAVSLASELIAFVTHFNSTYRLIAGPLILTVCYTFLYPMGPALTVSMYNDFRLRREGGDLAARMGTLNTA